MAGIITKDDPRHPLSPAGKQREKDLAAAQKAAADKAAPAETEAEKPAEEKKDE